MKEHNGYNVAELTRRLHNMIQITTVTETDESNRVFRVRLEDEDSAELPWPAEVGRNFRRWRPLRIGQQVVIASPGGDPAQAVMIGELYAPQGETVAIETPADPADLDVIEFDDGTVLQYDSGAHVLSVSTAGDTVINVKGNADVRVSGDAQLISTGRMLVKSLTRLVLKGPSKTITL